MMLLDQHHPEAARGVVPNGVAGEQSSYLPAFFLALKLSLDLGEDFYVLKELWMWGIDFLFLILVVVSLIIFNQTFFLYLGYVDQLKSHVMWNF